MKKTNKKNKRKKLITVFMFFISLFIRSMIMASCSNEMKEDTEKEELGRIFIQELVEGEEKIMIFSKGINISKLELISLEYDKEANELIEGEIIEAREDIEEGEKIILNVIYSEGIPRMKLIWELSCGDMGEYVIAYNGKYGRNPDKTIIYFNNGEVLEEEEDMNNKKGYEPLGLS